MNQLQIVITLDPQAGSLQVSGAIQNKLVALGLIEMGKEALLEMHRKAASGDAPRIIPFNRLGGDPGPLPV